MPHLLINEDGDLYDSCTGEVLVPVWPEDEDRIIYQTVTEVLKCEEVVDLTYDKPGTTL